MTAKLRLQLASALLMVASLTLGVWAVNEHNSACVRYDYYSAIELPNGGWVPERRFNFRDCDGNPLPTPERWRERPTGSTHSV